MSIRQGVRIGFCGAGGAGKTTSAEFISEALSLPLLKSASRMIYENQSLSEELVLKFSDEQKLDLQKQIFDLKAANDRNFSYVADRTILDHYCYNLAYCGGFMENKQFGEFEESTRSLMLSTYSHIFYFPWGYWVAEKSDGVRQDRYSWQSQIDAILVGYLSRWNIPAFTVPQLGGKDERNEFIKKAILKENK